MHKGHNVPDTLDAKDLRHILMALDFENFLVSYPPQFGTDDVGRLQKTVASKREFAELISGTNDSPPGPYGFYPHQTFMERFLTHWDVAVLLDEPGTGKTRRILAPCEHFKGLYAQRGEAAPIHGAIILASGPTGIGQWYEQIACCSPDYATNSLRKLNKAIEAWYYIDTPYKFANTIRNKITGELLDPESVRERFSNRIYYIDEIHGLRNESKATGETEADRLLEHFRDHRGGQSTEDTQRDRDHIYKALEHVFKYARNIKKAIGSGTIMYNRVDELPRAVNLILPDSHKLVYKNKYTYEELAHSLSNVVCFVAQSGTTRGAVINQMANLNWKGRGLAATRMVPGGLQERVYNTIQETRGNESFSHAKRAAALMVWPDGSYTGMPEKYVSRDAPGRYSFTPEYKRYIQADTPMGVINNLRQYACKIAAWLEEVYKVQQEAKKGKRMGTWFVHNDFVGSSGGVIPCGLFLEYILGYEEYTGADSAFKSGESHVRVPIACSRTPRDEASLRPRKLPTGKGAGKEFIANAQPMPALEKKVSDAPVDPSEIKITLAPGPWRYSIISAIRSEAQQREIFQLLNSEENAGGEYLHIVLCSPVAETDISIYHATNNDMLTSSWTDAGLYQKVNRGMRVGSHDAIMRKYGIDRVPVNVRYHAAITTDIKDANEFNSVDIRMQNDSMTKGVDIEEEMGYLRSMAVDGHINWNRNHARYPGLKLLTSVASAGETGLAGRVLDSKEMGQDVSTYNVYYAEDVVARVLTHVKKHFRHVATLDVFTLQRQLGTAVSNIVLERALARLVDDPLPVRDNLAHVGYIQEAGSVYFLSPHQLPGDANLFDIQYTSSRRMVKMKPFSDVIRSQISDQTMARIQEAVPMTIGQLDIETKVKLVERALITDEKKRDDLSQQLLSRYRFFIHEIPVPYSQIPLRMHRLYALDLPTSKTSHAARVLTIRKDVRYRILGPAGWRDLNPDDRNERKKMEIDLKQQLKTFRDQEWFLTEIDGDYRIHRGKDVGEQKRASKGRIVSHEKKAAIIEHVIKLGVPYYDSKWRYGYNQEYSRLIPNNMLPGPGEMHVGKAMQDVFNRADLQGIFTSGVLSKTVKLVNVWGFYIGQLPYEKVPPDEWVILLKYFNILSRSNSVGHLANALIIHMDLNHLVVR